MSARAVVGRLLMCVVSRVPNRKFTMTRATYEHARLADDAASLDELVQGNIAYVYGYYVRLARLHCSRYRRRLYEEMDCSGADVLRDAARTQRGVVLVSTHLGDFDAAGAWLAEVAGLTPVVTTANMPSHTRQGFFDCVRHSCGVVLRRQAATRMRDLLEELRRGRLVLVMLDRCVAGRTVPVTFLGRPIDAPAAAWELARASGALLVPGATWRQHDGSHVLWCGHATIVSSDAASPEHALQMQAVADQLTYAVRQAPHQLHVPADAAQMSWRPSIVETARDLDAATDREAPIAVVQAPC